MSLDDEILSEERLDESQELMLYNMSLRQTSQRAAGGHEGTHVLLSRVEEDPAYQKMIEQGLIECRVYGGYRFLGGSQPHCYAKRLALLRTFCRRNRAEAHI